MKRPRPLLTARRLALCCLGFAALLLGALAIGISFGSGEVSLADLWNEGLSERHQAILFQIRIPRVLVAALLGGALSIAGVSFQALLRNPLADPYVLGVSGGASIGGVIALTLIELKQDDAAHGGSEAVRYRDIDFAGVARALGVSAHRVTSTRELERALRSPSGEGPVLIDAIVDASGYGQVLGAIRGARAAV